jgi:beta-lactamase regulating signal transducer with metallopeptidase domain
MMLTILAEAALRAFVLGGAVWLGLYLFRVRNPNVHMTAWTLVLLASLAMPLLMHWTTVTITVQAPLAPPAESFVADEALLPDVPGAPLSSAGQATVAAALGHSRAINWPMIAAVVYALVAGLLLMRLVLGLHLSWRIARAARRLREDWTSDWDVRVSAGIGGPVTVGSTILVPRSYTEWDATKRQAVLAHESAHVANRDFYILLLASLNRALFWFSPFAWWQLSRLAELAEIISDDRAIEALADRVSYAEVLLELVQGPQPKPAGLEMARACTVPTRIEIILAAATLPARLGWRKRLSIVAAIVPFVVVSAGSIAYRTQPAAARAVDGTSETATAPRLPQQVDFYAIGPGAVFAISRDGDELYGQVTGQRRLRLASLQDGSYSYSAAAGEITFAPNSDQPRSELKLHRLGRDERAAHIAALPGDPSTATTDVAQYAGWYALAANRVLTVTRDGDRLLVQETGRPAFAARAKGADAFAADNGDVVIFLRNGETRVTRVLFQDDVIGARLASRVDEARAKSAEAAFAKRLAEVSERFTGQAPAPGGKDAVLRGIADLQHGTPNYERMTPDLAAKIRHQAGELHETLLALGALEQIFFRGVGPGGYDIYGIKFAKGSAEIRLSLAADGRAADAIFRADGNDEPGEIAACSREAELKPRNETVPINVYLFNATGSDIRIYNLDNRGQRVEHGTIADNMSSSILTSVGSPWVITDRAGQCLQVVLPGERTRSLAVEMPAILGVPARATTARSAPQAGSEEALRKYILDISQGQPDYEHMTPAVAAFTRSQLPFSQAILGKLGPLRALSFRVVSSIGSDIYMAHFANGSAEWRISMTRNGTIARIALGPQY